VPVLVESGDELIRYFELDAFRLDTIINDNAEAGRQVDYDDIALLAMSGLREEYLVMRLADGSEPAEVSSRNRSLRGYLYDKYVYRGGAEQAAAATNGHATATNGHATAKAGLDEAAFPANGGVMVQMRPVG